MKEDGISMSKWNVDVSHSNIGFSVRHMMVAKVRGRFDEFEGTIDGDANDLIGANINFNIDASSIDTNSGDRDNHLRSEDFFDVEKYPIITFVSTDIVKAGENTYSITGDFTIKDVTKQVTFEAEYQGAGKNPWGVDVVAYEASTKISREAFGLTWNQALEAGGVLVGDEISITLELQVNPA